MPGLSAVFRRDGGKPLSADSCLLIRNEMLHFPFYFSKTVLASASADIGFTGYEGYPFVTFDHPEYTLVLEGRIYNIGVSDLERRLRDMAEIQIRSERICDGAFQRFLLDADGEFVIMIHDKVRNRVVAANDLLGRLPLYCFHDAESFILARELKFILPFMPRLSFNRNGVLEYLLYGYPFGDNTLVEKARFFPAATYAGYDLTTGKSVEEPYYTLNMDPCVNSGNRETLVVGMKGVFMKTLSDRMNWVDPKKTIISLSGGLDSRGTLAGMQKLGGHPVAVTAGGKEEGAARKVAKALGAEVYTIPQGDIKVKRPFEEIVFLKDGLDCHPDLAQLYENLQDMRNRFGGDIAYFTGIFGGEVLRQSHLTGGLPNFNSLVNYLMDSNDTNKYSTDKTALIMGIDRARLREHLLQHLQTFPEKDLYRKYVRFRHEFDIRFAGEAEDRNRFYFWTLSPYFSFPFFSYAMGIEENKKNILFFREFLVSLNPSACAAPYYNFNLPLSSSFPLKLFAVFERLIRHAVVKRSVRLTGRFIKGCLRALRRTDRIEEERLIAQKRELIGLWHNNDTIKEIFTYPGMAGLIENENDTRGLDRLQIVFAYLAYATRWHFRIRESVGSGLSNS